MEKRLLTREELAELLGMSTRTIDRYRSKGVEFGEVKVFPGSPPRFDSVKVWKAIEAGQFPKARKPPGESVTRPTPTEADVKDQKTEPRSFQPPQDPQPSSEVAI